jgi:hypothetical protein
MLASASIASSLLLGLLGGAAHARSLPIQGVNASSELGEYEGVSYAVKNLIDKKASTVWVEGEEGSGLGASITLDLGGEQTVTQIKLWNGNWYTADFWQRHNRAKEVEVEFSDGSKQNFTLKDEMAAEVIRLPAAVKTSSVKIKIKSIYRGNTFNDTCISEVQVQDDAPEPFVVPVAAKASSVYAADADGTYEPVNTWDGLLDTMWCESDPGDGAGQWIEFDLGGSQSVGKLGLRNGNAYSLGMNMKANRAKVLTLSFSDGSTARVEVKPSMTDASYSFPARSTSKVRLTVDEVVKGTEYNDLCLSEVQFSR